MTSTLPGATRPRWRLLLWLAYPLLAITGAATHQQGWSLAAIVLLLSLLLWPALATRRVAPWLLWLAGFGAILWLAWRGFAGLLLDAVPLLVNLLLAWLFGRSLRAGRQPLVARFIEAIEGPSRLALPEVARYARQLTWFWTLLLALQAGLLGLLLSCVVPGGLLATLGHVPPLQLPQGWVTGYMHLGGYALIVVAFGLEYLFRRWHLRHLPHLRPHELAVQLAAGWHHLLRGGKMAP